MQQGTVKFFNESRGFGFITPENGADVFVHVSALVDTVRENDQVTFDVEEDEKGRVHAVNVKVA